MDTKVKVLIEVPKEWLETLQLFEKDCPDGLGRSDEIILAGEIREESKASVLDTIESEIMHLDYETECVDYDCGDMSQTAEVHMICREEVLQIIDEHRRSTK